MPLNKEHFITVAGDVSELDDEIRRRCKKVGDLFESESLCRVQEQQFARGRRGIELFHTIHGYTWRDSSGLTGFAIRCRVQTIEHAISWAKDWVGLSPEGMAEAFISRATAERIRDFKDTGRRCHLPSDRDKELVRELLAQE